MFRPWVLGLLAGAAALALFRRSQSSSSAVLEAAVAAEKLRLAWAKNHTVV